MSSLSSLSSSPTQSLLYCCLIAARATHRQLRQAAFLRSHQGFPRVAGHHHAPHSQIQSHFNSLRRLAPLLPFGVLPRHHHKHKKELHRVQPGSKAHHQRRHNGKKTELRGRVAPSFLRLPAERMPGYQTFQLNDVIPRNFKEVKSPTEKLCNLFEGAPLCGGTHFVGALWRQCRVKTWK